MMPTSSVCFDVLTGFCAFAMAIGNNINRRFIASSLSFPSYNVPMPKPVAHPYVSPWINEDIQLFRKNVKRFFNEEFVPHEARWREQHRVDADAWTKAGEVGILCTDIPEEYGGGGG